jgi:hypothetical protein
MGLKNMWVDDADYDAIYAEVARRKEKTKGRVSGAEVLHEWLGERRLYMGMEEGHQVNEGPGAPEE